MAKKPESYGFNLNNNSSGHGRRDNSVNAGKNVRDDRMGRIADLRGASGRSSSNERTSDLRRTQTTREGQTVRNSGQNGSFARDSSMPPSYSSYGNGSVQRVSDRRFIYPVKAIRNPDMGGRDMRRENGRYDDFGPSAGRRGQNFAGYNGSGASDIRNGQNSRYNGGAPQRDAGVPSAGLRGANNEYTSNRNARRIDLTEEQRANYERAYRAKHGHSPYVERGQQSAREDRRKAFLRDEEEKSRREAEAARLAQVRLREEQETARREAEKERRRREAVARRAAEERVREAEKQKLEIERRREYEQKKRRYARERALEKERERVERRRLLEKKLKRRRFLRAVAFHFRVVLVTFLITSMVMGLLGYMHFWKGSPEVSKKVTYLYGDEKISGVSKDHAYCNGVMCVDIIRIADLFGFYTVGDSTRVKFIIPDDVNPQYITIVPGSLYVEVNGTPLVLSAPSRYEGNSLWVSSEIMECFSGGVNFTSENSGNASIQKVISRDENGKAIRDAEGNLTYDKVVLSYEGLQTIEAPDLSLIFGDESLGIGVGTNVVFNTDLEQYEHYMNPSDSTAYLILANKQHLLASDYVPEGLVDVEGTRADGREIAQLCLYAAKSLEAMFVEMKDAGYTDVTVTEGYVGYQTQVDKFNDLIAHEMSNGLGENDAMRQVLSYFSAPGTNEHQTGLSVDIHNLPEADVSFADEEVFLWLKDNAWKFGYILRYPEGKDDVTGHSFEPWHYRYVGRYAAEKIYKNGITLEEYLNGNLR